VFLHRAKKCPIGRPIIFGIPAKRPHAQSRTKSAPQLFVLTEHLQATLQSQHHDRKPRLLDLLFQPISHLVRDIRLPNIHKMLKFIERQQAHMAAPEEFTQSDAFADCIAT
jgi:hypothetical protein